VSEVIEEYVKDVCKMGKGIECCRYLMMGSKGWECAKLSDEAKVMIDNRVKAGKFNAQGDNCEGKGLS